MLKKILSSVLESRQIKELEEQLNTVLAPRVPFLQGADETLVSELATAITPIHFKRDEVLFEEGDPGDCLYLVAAGTVRVCSEDELIADLGIGGCFGEGALFRDGVRAASVIAIEDVTLYQVGRESFEKLTEKYRKFRYRLRTLHEDRTAEGIERSIEQNLLKNTPFLQNLGGSLISEIARLLERKQYAAGEDLIHEGQVGATFFLLEEGTVGIKKSGQQIAELGPGSCLGEGSILERTKCSATVTALTETHCLQISRETFLHIIERYPVLGNRLRDIHLDRI